ncbi:hypothetical protein J7438_25395, partial [Thalassotalea sp. G20_0]|uniref:hypothetical protein n=1 Tax=Thalassotalea sp. G20_0 TaxID=2821093 RepID=UPI001AD988A4
MAASTAPPGCRGEPIPVDGAAVLAKVGKDFCYPANGTYAQTTDIDAGNHSPILHFTGEYNGNGNTISNLKGCLFNSLEGNGAVRNLTITNGHIDRAGLPETNDTGSAALVACTMSGGSRQENIVVENSKIRVTAVKPWVQQHRQLGMLAGKMNDSAVLRDNQINNVNIAIQGSGIDVGMLAGQALDRATIDSNQVENCKVLLSGIGTGRRTLNRSRAETNVNIGLIAGKMVGNEHNNVVVKNSTLIHNCIESSEGIFAANIGGVAGRADFARIEDTQAHNQNKIHYHSIIIDGRIAMVVADARHCTILDTTTSDNHLQATANSLLPTHVGIVTADCHNSTIKHTLDIDSDLELSHSRFRVGSGGHAAVTAAVAAAVAEGCSIHNTTARETIIAAETDKSSVAIAVAFNDANTTVHQTTAIDCGLFAWEKNTNSYTGSAAVGVAAGRQDNFGRIRDTRVCGSVIKGYRAGLAAGDPHRNFSGTVACNTELTSFADGISTTVNLACDNASCPATERADIATVATSDRIPATIKHLS